jgi:hypothetical protein
VKKGSASRSARRRKRIESCQTLSLGFRSFCNSCLVWPTGSCEQDRS